MNYPQHPALRKYTQTLSLYKGCLYAGAIGDALGAAVEFSSRDEILKKFGPYGIQDYAPCYGGLAKFTDDTQMTLFTAEALLITWYQEQNLANTHHKVNFKNAYLRWLNTQNGSIELASPQGFLYLNQELYSSRAPGMTCLSGLKQIAHTDSFVALNNSKGCGTVMRVAPIAIMAHASLNNDFEGNINDSLVWVYDRAIETAALTHGHPTGQIAAAAFALILFAVLCGKTVMAATELALELIEQKEFHEETSQLLKRAITESKNTLESHIAIEKLGQGWIAEEALAIAVYCALKAKSIEQGILMAVNITGDSDSTGSMAGQLLGAYFGFEAIPHRFLAHLELESLLEQITKDWLFVYFYKHGIFEPQKRNEIIMDLANRYAVVEI